MKKETYEHINNLWWVSLIIGIWAVVAFILNRLRIFETVNAWQELYPILFPFAIILFLFGFIISSNYKIAIRFGWIKLEKPYN